jgi:hypothetical protein
MRLRILRPLFVEDEEQPWECLSRNSLRKEIFHEYAATTQRGWLSENRGAWHQNRKACEWVYRMETNLAADSNVIYSLTLDVSVLGGSFCLVEEGGFSGGHLGHRQHAPLSETLTGRSHCP